MQWKRIRDDQIPTLTIYYLKLSLCRIEVQSGNDTGGICYVRQLPLRGSHGSAWAMSQKVNLE